MIRKPIRVAAAAVMLAGSAAYFWTGSLHAEMASSEGHQGHAMHGQAMHDQSMHSGHNMQTGLGMPLPGEAGQSAFAAIAEIVAMLEADPQTDWSKVNISALREHLVDMNNLMLGARATRTDGDGSISFAVEGEGAVLRAIQTMVPAHSRELDKAALWTVTADTTPTGAVMTLSSGSAAELEKAKALGFFGLMALGAHHQPHHLAMATGRMAH